MIRSAQRGFTLAELMLALAILAVIVAIAVPAYSSYVERAKVAQAETDIIAISAQIEGYYQDAHAYPSSLVQVGAAGKLDPWGHPYVYYPLDSANIGEARKDKNLVPINSDFDLYSVGPDGKSAPPLTAPQSRDDVVRANNGAFVGLASDYGQ